ncbi:hypothetical protein Goari_017500 [Gossypium aridum]|uniref:Uncharacterized protein n=1 Tax=Gossypium aridum TaxID=34290 RepID=A0A7J8WM89_GOSAI|nr:hypothetical protein [Gossypium aridum]
MESSKPADELVKLNPTSEYAPGLEDTLILTMKGIAAGMQNTEAKVHLECKNRTDERIVYSKDAVSDKLGMYSIPVEGDHEDELCEVRLIESPRNNCNEVMESWRKARVELTRRDGVTDLTRQTNNLGFKIKPEDVDTKACVKVLEEMGFVVDGKTGIVVIPS